MGPLFNFACSSTCYSVFENNTKKRQNDILLPFTQITLIMNAISYPHIGWF